MNHDPAHSHDYDHGNRAAERSTWIVLWITLVFMLAELVAGFLFQSMALLADGWHMGSHAIAIGLSAMAYSTARRLATDHHFAFGSWKIEVLAGYTSAVILLGVAGIMVGVSLERLVAPKDVHYPEALAVAVVGLLVNLVSAWILGRAGHPHEHHHGHHHGHHHHGHGPHSPDGDLNLNSARLHVIADAATSVLAILALLGGWWLGLRWLDPAMGLVGAVLVTRWAIGLLREGSRILLDREMDHPMTHEVRSVVARLPAPESVLVTDLHVWRVGRHQFACILRLATQDRTLTSRTVREQLAHYPALVHATVEIDYSPPP